MMVTLAYLKCEMCKPLSCLSLSFVLSLFCPVCAAHIVRDAIKSYNSNNNNNNTNYYNINSQQQHQHQQPTTTTTTTTATIITTTTTSTSTANNNNNNNSNNNNDHNNNDNNSNNNKNNNNDNNNNIDNNNNNNDDDKTLNLTALLFRCVIHWCRFYRCLLLSFLRFHFFLLRVGLSLLDFGCMFIN